MDVLEQDFGATGPAALARPHETAVVLADAVRGSRSRFRDSGVEVRRYYVTQLDLLRANRSITYRQWCAARHATALWRGASLDATVTSRYEEWVSGARGRWVATDEAEDEAAPWRELVSSLPMGPAVALEAMVMNTMRLDSLPRLLEALDRIALEIGA